MPSDFDKPRILLIITLEARPILVVISIWNKLNLSLIRFKNGVEKTGVWLDKFENFT